MEEDAGARASVSDSRAQVHWASVQGDNNMATELELLPWCAGSALLPEGLHADGARVSVYGFARISDDYVGLDETADRDGAAA